MIQHVALETRRADLEAAVGFWALVGFVRVEPPPSLAARAAWVQAPGATQIHLLYTEEPVVLPEGHVAIVVADYEAALARLRAAGFDVDERTRHWGAPRSVVVAPGGHRVELMASAPVEAQA
jgi:catechol 2,3-dioxygenase-like lactoylglutathione lyase family enzyme